MMFFNTFLGCFIFLITNTSLLYAAHLPVRRFLPAAPASVRLAAIGTLYYAFIIVIFQALSPFHAIGKIWVTLSCLLLALVLHLLWGNYGNPAADVRPLVTWLRDGLNSRWCALIVICGFVVLLSLSRALLMPPLAWDCLTYHLTLAALWIKKGTLFLLQAPYQMQNVHFPLNGDIFSSWLLLPFHNDLLVNTMNFPITLLGGISCYALARELGLNRREASFAPALICFAPMIYSQMTTGYVDNAAFAFCTASVLFVLRYLWKGYLYDGLLALAAAGIMLGIKYSVIPVAAIIITATMVKTLTLVSYSGFARKAGLILLGLLIVCSLGGRQYIRNSIEAGNPLYPFPVTIFNKTFEGRDTLAVEKTWGIKRLWNVALSRSTFWEREYKKFCYFSLAAGPKYLFFLLLALTSLFARPRHVPGRCWYLLYLMWLIPIIVFYTTTTANIAKDPSGNVVDTRYFSLYIALFTVQGLAAFQKYFKHSEYLTFVLVAFVGWDLFYSNKNHLWRIEILYPVAALLIPLMIIIGIVSKEKFKAFSSGEKIFSHFPALPIKNRILLKRLSIYAFSFFLLVAGLNLLQNYRDATRYTYYRAHSDYHNFPRDFIAGWEFLDKPGETKTIALTAAWQPPGTGWFFYPLMGRWLQNDVTYASAKYKWEVPVWLHRGLLGGYDFSIWLHNLKRKEVDYIFVQKPWPRELFWIKRNPDTFRLVFSDVNCNIHKYID